MMKNVKSIFSAILFVAFFAPNLVNAQIESYPDYTACTIGLIDHWSATESVNPVSAELRVTPDLSIHLKAIFDVNGTAFEEFIPEKGKAKCEIVRLALWSGGASHAGELIVEFETFGILDSDGYMKVVYNTDQLVIK